MDQRQDRSAINSTLCNCYKKFAPVFLLSSIVSLLFLSCALRFFIAWPSSIILSFCWASMRLTSGLVHNLSRIICSLRMWTEEIRKVKVHDLKWGSRAMWNQLAKKILLAASNAVTQLCIKWLYKKGLAKVQWIGKSIGCTRWYQISRKLDESSISLKVKRLRCVIISYHSSVVQGSEIRVG